MIPEPLYNKILLTLKNSDLDLEAEHGENTLHWVLKLEPKASLALQIAALGHDIERSRISRYKSSDFDDHAEYKRQHSIKGAEMMRDLLEDFSIDTDVINQVVELITLHEVGGTEEADLIKDADSISFFDNNLEFYIGYKGIDAAKKQIEYKYQRASKRAQQYIDTLENYKQFKKENNLD
jgi:hypothetical protein